MLWVGGGILVHGLAAFGVTAPEHIIHGLSEAVREAVPFDATCSPGWYRRRARRWSALSPEP